MADAMRRWSHIYNVDTYARKAVLNNFIKQKVRDREGLVRAVKGGHVAPEAQECIELTAREDKQWVDQLVCPLPRAGQAYFCTRSRYPLMSVYSGT